ncbi:hypothetical protein F383_38369 [Gossypium arboreum]|uniref:Uncharacterized protein n=1 Tax=Gossypium arboreum TaxID=29729 RepID=A0A0B0MB61_GOSAR|nr:hypothetical protein F383_38369 [Gossypium arboreum]
MLGYPATGRMYKTSTRIYIVTYTHNSS